jgi:Ca2+-transporting ATPase
MNETDNLQSGLRTEEVLEIRARVGENRLQAESGSRFFLILKEVFLEPMTLLLVLAASVYFLLGKWEEGWMLLVAIGLVASISIFQINRSDSALRILNKLSQATFMVCRDGVFQPIPGVELVPGDLVKLDEGMSVPADGIVTESHDLAINEASLTGESVPVARLPGEDVFSGTTLSSGSLTFKVTKTGAETRWGQLGKRLQHIEKEKTQLQLQIEGFVKKMAWIGLLAFLIIVGVSYFQTGVFLLALVQGLTLAMAMIPEEIPVAFASFMALGSVRMAGFQVLAREPRTVESLGSATVICTDKTGTLTTDGMELHFLSSLETDLNPLQQPITSPPFLELLRVARLACEPDPFDPMDVAVDAAWKSQGNGPIPIPDREYPLTGKPPIMVHGYFDQQQANLNAKGGLETLLRHEGIPEEEKLAWLKRAREFAAQGYRVLGVGAAEMPVNALPSDPTEIAWRLLGLLVFYNPPKENAIEVVEGFKKAGIQVKMITGDYAETALAIAHKLGISLDHRVCTGSEIMVMPESELRAESERTSVFARMFPEAKLKVVEALKANGHVVAMTGDGVNDGPALKAAHIGVAMGKKGTEIARQAASLILLDDNLAQMLKAIGLGRNIYQNLKKAISYIVSIHIPIILLVVVPLVLGWEITGIFSPIHVIFLELVMGPTCSMAFENEPADPLLMEAPPRKSTSSFFSIKELGRAVIQGVVISFGLLALYYYLMEIGNDLPFIRAMVFTALVFANVFLTLENRSFHQPVWSVLFKPNAILWWLLSLTLAIGMGGLYWSPMRHLFGFVSLKASNLGLCLALAFGVVFWLEIVKAFRKRKKPAL